MTKPKSKGSGIYDEHSGFLARNDEEYEHAKAANPYAKKYAREFLEYGESKEGYWTFIIQIK